MKIVFDLDDTICKHTKREFSKAKPILATVERIRELKEQGCEISVYTARGQNSCAGDIRKIEAKYRKDIESWLVANKIPFDELIFGKPLGDLYVDDKGVDLVAFQNMTFENLKGNSGGAVFRAGNKVVKSCKNPWDQYAWFIKAGMHGVNVPKVDSVVLENITMEYIPDEGVKDDLDTFCKILMYPLMFRYIPDGQFSVKALLERVKEHIVASGKNVEFAKLFGFLSSREEELSKEASFCHGDLTISNCLLYEGKIYLIDPNPSEKYSSWLLDLAKIRFSLNGGELYLRGENFDEDCKLFMALDRLLEKEGFKEVVVALEATHWLRMIKYAKMQSDIDFVVQKAMSLEGLL